MCRVKKWLIVFCGILFVPFITQAQGTFNNLNFEWPGFDVQGWTALLDNSPAPFLFDAVTEGPASVSIQSSFSSVTPIESGHSVLLRAAAPGFSPSTAAIAQTARIPENVRYMIFFARGSSLVVTFNGQRLNSIAVESNPSYTTFAADITPIVAETGELRFICPPLSGGGGEVLIDNIVFSTSADVRPR